MTWNTPSIPRELMSTTVVHEFNNMERRELGEKLRADCHEITMMFDAVPWTKIVIRDFESIKDKPSKLKFLLDQAQKIVDEQFDPLIERCQKFRDKVIEIEENEVEDGSGAKDFLLDIAKSVDEFCEKLDKEAVRKYLEGLGAASQGGRSNIYDEEIEMRLNDVKEGLVEIVNGMKKVAKLEFDAGSEPEIVNDELAYGYRGICNFINNYIEVLKKASDPDAEKVKEEFQPVLKFEDDESLFSCMIEHEELEREIAAVVNDETEEDDVKAHCKAILNAVRALPSKYKQ